MPPLPILMPSDAAPFGFDPGRTASTVGAAQRASLGRGLAFVLLLATAALASVYVPPACRSPDGTAGAVMVGR